MKKSEGNTPPITIRVKKPKTYPSPKIEGQRER
jgi:hypothetical protein